MTGMGLCHHCGIGGLSLLMPGNRPKSSLRLWDSNRRFHVGFDRFTRCAINTSYLRVFCVVYWIFSFSVPNYEKIPSCYAQNKSSSFYKSYLTNYKFIAKKLFCLPPQITLVSKPPPSSLHVPKTCPSHKKRRGEVT